MSHRATILSPALNAGGQNLEVHDTWTGNPGDSYGFVGDSVFARQPGLMHTEMDDAYNIAIEAHGGYRTDQLYTYGDTIAAGSPKGCYQSTGLNDAGIGGMDAATIEANYATMHSHVGLSVIMIPITMFEDPNYPVRAQVNTWIRANYTYYVDWNAVAIVPGSHLMAADRIHPNEAGQIVLAQMIRDVADLIP